MTATATRKNSDSAKTATHYSEGDPVKVLAPGAHNGEVVGVLEVDAEGKMVRTEFGWLTYDQVEPSSQKRRTIVDGKEADVVLDGQTGGVKDETMIHPSLEDLVRALAKANEHLGKATMAKKRASEAHKDAQGAVNAVVAEIIEYYGEKDPQLSLGVTQESAQQDDED